MLPWSGTRNREGLRVSDNQPGAVRVSADLDSERDAGLMADSAAQILTEAGYNVERSDDGHSMIVSKAGPKPASSPGTADDRVLRELADVTDADIERAVKPPPLQHLNHDRARLMNIPLNKIDGREPVPAMEDGYQPGREITDPVEVMYQPSTDTYMLYAGNHRVHQAEINGETHIKAYVEDEQEIEPGQISWGPLGKPKVDSGPPGVQSRTDPEAFLRRTLKGTKDGDRIEVFYQGKYVVGTVKMKNSNWRTLQDESGKDVVQLGGVATKHRWRLLESGEPSYRGGHQPPKDSPSMDDLTGSQELPDDVYTAPQHYMHSGEPGGAPQTRAALRKAKGNPDAIITVYRAAPSEATQINPGDWVTTERAYARKHAMQSDDPSQDWPVLSVKVPARDLHWGGNDLIEWGYWPSQVESPSLEAMSQQWDRLVSQAMVEPDVVSRSAILDELDRLSDRMSVAEPPLPPGHMNSQEGANREGTINNLKKSEGAFEPVLVQGKLPEGLMYRSVDVVLPTFNRPIRRFEVWKDGKTVGKLDVLGPAVDRKSTKKENTGDIEDVRVNAAYQRRGIASYLMDRANQELPYPVRHTNDLTVDSVKWKAAKPGGESIDWREAGRAAARAGDLAAPALNLDVQKALTDLPVGSPEGKRILSEYSAGWNEANLATPVEVVAEPQAPDISTDRPWDTAEAARQYAWGVPEKSHGTPGELAFATNFDLRRGSTDLPPDEARLVHSLDAAIESAPALTGPKTVYRVVETWRGPGTGADPAPGDQTLHDLFMQHLQDGTPYVELGYMSTSTREDESLNFLNDKGAMLQIELPVGTKALNLDQYTDATDYKQDEWLLPRGTRLQFLESSPSHLDDMIQIKARVIGEDPAPRIDPPSLVLGSVKVPIGADDLVYRHKVGSYIVVSPDGSLMKYSATGKANPKTSATPDKLAAGHGQWTLVPQSSIGGADAAIPATDVGRPGGDNRAEGPGRGLADAVPAQAVITAPTEVETKSIPVRPSPKRRVPMDFAQAASADIDKYIDDDRYVLQQKVDGIRGQLVIEPGKAPWFRSKSGDRLVNSSAAKVIDPMLKKMGDAIPADSPSYVVDGEVLDGKWYVFDMVQISDEKMPQADRNAIATEWVKTLRDAGITNVEALPTARSAGEKKALWNAVLAGGAEGVMAKRTDAGYNFGSRVDHTIKIKVRPTADVVVMAVGTDGKNSADIGLLVGGKMTRVGTVAMQGKPDVKTGDVIEVAYLWANPVSHKIQQAAMERKRPDKIEADATSDQLRYVDKTILDVQSDPIAMTDDALRQAIKTARDSGDTEYLDRLLAEAVRRGWDPGGLTASTKHVRTPEGQNWYGEPIGSPIVADPIKAHLDEPGLFSSEVTKMQLEAMRELLTKLPVSYFKKDPPEAMNVFELRTGHRLTNRHPQAIAHAEAIFDYFDLKPGLEPEPGQPGPLDKIEIALLAMLKRASLRDDKGPVEKYVRRITDSIGVDPYDVDIGQLNAHLTLHETPPQSKYWFKSPCWASRKIDFAVHALLPALIEQKHPGQARALRRTSPRWEQYMSDVFKKLQEELRRTGGLSATGWFKGLE